MTLDLFEVPRKYLFDGTLVSEVRSLVWHRLLFRPLCSRR
jgi:hypothetical protein